MTASPAPRILVIEDREVDRRYLATLLRHHGYEVEEAVNGLEGLAAVEACRPDLVISDVLMPTVDGYEFVRRLRRTKAGVDLPVMFYTATFHERKARDLAQEGGVLEVLIKPTEPEVLISKVASVLAREKASPQPIADEPFESAHRRLTSDMLVEKIRDLEASERRMAGIVDIGQRLIEERDPIALLNRVCAAVRDITVAQYAVVGVISGTPERVSLVLSSGFSLPPEHFDSDSDLSPWLLRVVRDRQPWRDRVSDSEAGGGVVWPAGVSSFMLVPLASRNRVYGFLGLAGKIGGAGFSAADEQVATTLGVQGGIAYENALLVNQLSVQADWLRESQEVTDFALAAAGVGISQRDLVTGRVELSKPMAAIFGISETSFALSAEFYERMHPQDRDGARREMERAIASGSEYAFDARVSSDDAKTRHFHFRGLVQRDHAGRPSRLITVAIEFTERRQLEEQLRHAQKMEAIGQLAGGVAHDFNNLLTAILGYAHFLQPTLSTDEQRAELAEIVGAGKRAASLTEQLLAFSRQQPQQLRLLDLNQLIGDMGNMLRRLIGESVTLETALAVTVSPVRVDRGQLEQVIMNLIVNARDAMPSGGTVRVETRDVVVANRSMVRLIVSDSGMGMSEETKARIFEPFFTTKEVGAGTGLGLSTVFGIVAQSEGTISVETAPGKGATFVVDLPVAGGEAVDLQQEAAILPIGNERILLVEDEPAVRFVAKSFLDRAGYRVVEAENPEAALKRAARDGPFDLLVTDVVMPRGSGPELYRRLCEQLPTLRVLYISGYAKEKTLDTRQLGRLAGFVAKPFTAESLTQAVRELLDRDV